ncbi:hypothetical protein DMC30DRAFT_423811 [Rhodotorula diobovata]|uniref:F-box domain-containing protein n=1 Tax=Rhodotorula diobovata TaxID=5288 RepID=A0A5C5FQQ7_9BASI|nr:hypothetical protein DMC30DRAFT_423811 [Rhodotorula diobovata]
MEPASRFTADKANDPATATPSLDQRLDGDHDRGTASSSTPHKRLSAGEGGGTPSAADNVADSAPPAKKARTSTGSTTAKLKGKGKAAVKAKPKAKPKVKGRTGALSAFLSMPLDVLVEISRHLDLPTLLAMSRANKMMRNVLARRSAAPIWTIVRNNVDFPDLRPT